MFNYTLLNEYADFERSEKLWGLTDAQTDLFYLCWETTQALVEKALGDE